MHHTVILKNNSTGRFHPMPFRPAPRPSEDVKIGTVCRHKSIGHHTEGFAELASAEEHVTGDPNRFWPTGIVMEWDGHDMPATTHYFPYLRPSE